MEQHGRGRAGRQIRRAHGAPARQGRGRSGPDSATTTRDQREPNHMSLVSTKANGMPIISMNPPRRTLRPYDFTASAWTSSCTTRRAVYPRPAPAGPGRRTLRSPAAAAAPGPTKTPIRADDRQPTATTTPVRVNNRQPNALYSRDTRRRSRYRHLQPEQCPVQRLPGAGASRSVPFLRLPGQAAHAVPRGERRAARPRSGESELTEAVRVGEQQVPHGVLAVDRRSTGRPRARPAADKPRCGCC